MSSENTESSSTDRNVMSGNAVSAAASAHHQNTGSNWERQVLPIWSLAI
jgi:hypothetical protein